MTLNSAQKTASSSSVKTNLGKTFGSSPFNTLWNHRLSLELDKNEYS